MLIDKDARIFGKLNIIDLFIVLGLIGAAVFGFMQFRGDGGFIGGPESQEFDIWFFVEQVENFTAERVQVGDALFDQGRGIHMGEVTAIVLEDAIIWNADQQGNTVRSNQYGSSSMHIQARISAVPSDNGILIGGNRYGVGHSLVVRASGSHIFMRISGLELVEAGA